MIGNDLVDLQEASLQSDWKRKGYLNKVFSAAEREQIMTTEQPDQLVWLFWSMKEAVYKIDSRLTGIRCFAPASLDCMEVSINGGRATGIVTVDQKTYFTESDLKMAYIHSTAAQYAARLRTIRKEVYLNPLKSLDYKVREPACVSHHGRYLALIF
jgi:hypothetical protein